jgi:hypothetical protein
MRPAKLSAGQGICTFAVNRRNNREADIPALLARGEKPKGPVDHSVPVLAVRTPEDKLLAVVFGYACHNTTMQFYEWCGDYAGFAQIELEKKHPGALAMFWIGCGADANPLPRGKIELCEQYGKELAGAVEDTISRKTSSLTEKVSARYAEIDLPFDTIPGKDKWAADTLSKNHATMMRAKRMLDLLESGTPIATSYSHYPVEVWRFGDQLTWVALGGEVVVDYNRRLKKELAGKGRVWVTGYANDVMAYIPSERVLKEGGYEGDTSQVPYGMPAKWGPGIENRIIGKVLDLAK